MKTILNSQNLSSSFFYENSLVFLKLIFIIEVHSIIEFSELRLRFIGLSLNTVIPSQLVPRASDLTHFMTIKHNWMKILNALEVGGKMEMGLCLLCDESFTLDHVMKHKGIRLVVIDMDEEVHNVAIESQGSSE